MSDAAKRRVRQRLGLPEPPPPKPIAATMQEAKRIIRERVRGGAPPA